MLVLLNAITLHADTSDFSAQGLSRTLASAVESARRSCVRLVLCESGASGSDGAAEEEGGRQSTIWNQRVPLLNGSINFGNESRTGKTAGVRDVIARWIGIESSEEHDDEEMLDI